MNTYAIIIFSTLLLNYVLHLVSGLFNLQSLRPELPGEFKEFYDAEQYRKSQHYTRVHTRFKLVALTFGLALILVFWFSDGFNGLDRIVRAWSLGPIWTGMFYIGIIVAGRALLTLPFTIYATFVIEERFGFNRTTPRTFILDLAKSTLLATLILGGLLASVLAFFELAGNRAWMYCWIATALAALSIHLIAPIWILPLFNKFTPLQEQKLRDAIRSYADTVSFPHRQLVVMDGSKRSGKRNAFFTGFGRNRRIVLFDTLVENHTIGELVAVLAHEIGHYKKKHIQQGLVISILHMGALFYLLSIFLSHPGLFEAFFMEHESIHVGLILFSLLYSPIELILGVLLHLLLRKNEYQADAFAAETLDEPDHLISGLKKLSAHNLDNLTPHPFHVFLNDSHPPVPVRVKAIRALTERKTTKYSKEADHD